MILIDFLGVMFYNALFTSILFFAQRYGDGAEVVSPALDHEIREVKDGQISTSSEEKMSPVLLNPKMNEKKPSEMSVRSAAQIVQEQCGK